MSDPIPRIKRIPSASDPDGIGELHRLLECLTVPTPFYGDDPLSSAADEDDQTHLLRGPDSVVLESETAGYAYVVETPRGHVRYYEFWRDGTVLVEGIGEDNRVIATWRAGIVEMVTFVRDHAKRQAQSYEEIRDRLSAALYDIERAR